MKQILIIILGLFGVAYGQSSPTSAKTRFVNGIYLGTKLDSYFAAADSNAVYWRADSALMAKYKGTARTIAFVGDPASGYVPYTGAVDNVNLGTFRLTARSVALDTLRATSSAGAAVYSNSGTQVALLGAGGGSNAAFYGFAGYDANRASSYTSRSFTDKNYVDSLSALRVRYTDTAAMLSNYYRTSTATGALAAKLNISDTATMLSNYRRKTTLIENADLRNSAITINGSSTSLGGSISVGTVTSVGLSVPTGFSVSNTPITSSGTLGLSFTAGYSLPTTASQALWDIAYNKRVVSAGLSSSQLTLTLGDASTVTASVPTFNQNTTGTAASLSAVLSKTLGGAGDVSGILKANGSGVVSAAVAGDITSLISGTYLPLSGGTLTGSLFGVSNNAFSSTTVGGSIGSIKNLTLTNTTGNVGDWAGLNFSYYNTTTNFAYIGTVLTNGSSNSAADLVFGVKASNAATSVTEYARLKVGGEFALAGSLSGTSLSMSGGVNLATSSGNVGIGTTSPSVALDFGSTTGKAFHLYTSSVDYYGFNMAQYDGGAFSTNIFSGYGGLIKFRTASGTSTQSTRMTITSGGNVLIKTTTESPNNEALQVAGSGSYAGSLKLGGATALTGIGGSLVTNDANTSGVQFRIADVSKGFVYATSSAVLLEAASGSSIQLAPNGSTALTLATTGAATFSSSVKAAGLIQPISIKTSNYTLTANDYTVIFDVSGGNRTATLPAGVEGQIFVIKIKGSANNLNVNPNGSETIEGVSSWTIFGSTCGDAAYTFQFVSGNWYIISSHIPNCL